MTSTPTNFGVGSESRSKTMEVYLQPLYRFVCRQQSEIPQSLSIRIAPSESRFREPAARLWWNGPPIKVSSAQRFYANCCHDPHRRDLAGHRALGYAGRARHGAGTCRSGVWLSPTSLCVPVRQQTGQSDESVDPRWSWYMTLCPSIESRQVPLGRNLAGQTTTINGRTVGRAGSRAALAASWRCRCDLGSVTTSRLSRPSSEWRIVTVSVAWHTILYVTTSRS